MTKQSQTNPRALAKARLRGILLGAARACFGERGFANTTMRGVAASAGVSTGAIFNKWDTKEQLFEEATGFKADPAHYLINKQTDEVIGRFLQFWRGQ